jgi:hypothetical protein
MAKSNLANKTGGNLESFVDNVIRTQGYRQVDDSELENYIVNEKPGYYARQVRLGKGIYGTGIQADFMLYYETSKPPLIIECKWQQSGGTADEKLPFLVANVRDKYPYPTCVVIDGLGFRPGAIAWLKQQKDSKIVAVLQMQEFQTWVNKGGLK